MPLKSEPNGEVKQEGGQGGGSHPVRHPLAKKQRVEFYDLCCSSEEEHGDQEDPIDLTLCTSSVEEQQGDPEGGMDSDTAPEREPSPPPQPSPSDHAQLAEKMARYQEAAQSCSLSGLGLDDVEKPGIPVSRTKLNEAILQDLASRNKSTDVRGRNSIPKNVLPKAQHRMLSVFGIEMVALERPESSSKSGSAEHYMLRSALPALLRHAYLRNARSDSRAPDPALATVVLSFIELSGGRVEQGKDVGAAR
uniref:MAGE domain-containing protein n=1 Tax=Dunaliella tertiolecta TaxID=3047 RepID=A0A7S3VPM9_DUNTE